MCTDFRVTRVLKVKVNIYSFFQHIGMDVIIAAYLEILTRNEFYTFNYRFFKLDRDFSLVKVNLSSN